MECEGWPLGRRHRVCAVPGIHRSLHWLVSLLCVLGCVGKVISTLKSMCPHVYAPQDAHGDVCATRERFLSPTAHTSRCVSNGDANGIEFLHHMFDYTVINPCDSYLQISTAALPLPISKPCGE